MMWKRAVAVLPGVVVSLLPKVTCPMCWPAYAGLVTALGLGFIMSERYLLIVMAIGLAVAVLGVAFRARERRGYTPTALGALAAAIVLAGKFHFDSVAAMYTGVALLMGASVWNIWPRVSLRSRAQWAAAGDISVGLRANRS